MSTDVALWTVKDAAVYWRVKPPTIRRWIKEGRLTCYPTPGGAVRLNSAEVKALTVRE